MKIITMPRCTCSRHTAALRSVKVHARRHQDALDRAFTTRAPVNSCTIV